MDAERKATMKAEHRAKYGRFVEMLGGPKRLRHLLPRVQRSWADLLAEDEHLNNVPLHLWDARHAAMLAGPWPRVEDRPRTWSLCETVCTLKEVARQIAEQEQADR